jgi:hypothetical protein
MSQEFSPKNSFHLETHFLRENPIIYGKSDLLHMNSSISNYPPITRMPKPCHGSVFNFGANSHGLLLLQGNAVLPHHPREPTRSPMSLITSAGRRVPRTGEEKRGELHATDSPTREEAVGKRGTGIQTKNDQNKGSGAVGGGWPRTADWEKREVKWAESRESPGGSGEKIGKRRSRGGPEWNHHCQTGVSFLQTAFSEP